MLGILVGEGGILPEGCSRHFGGGTGYFLKDKSRGNGKTRARAKVKLRVMIKASSDAAECHTCSFGLPPSLMKEMLTVDSGSPLSRSRACRYRHSRRRGKAHTNTLQRI